MKSWSMKKENPGRAETVTEKALNDPAGLIREGERVDDLQRNGLRIIQDPSLFSFGMDAVLLSAFASEDPILQRKQSARGLDLGTGTGIIPILMSARIPAEHLTGLEIQEASADLAMRSVRLNGLEERIGIVRGDIREADRIFAAASFDFVTCNPPYMIGSHGLQNPESAKAIARHEILCTFGDVAGAARALLKPGGHFFLVHRPFRLAEIISVLTGLGLEPKRMRLVYPYLDREPNMVLLDCVRGGKPRLQVMPPLVVYRAPGVYTDEIYEIYGMDPEEKKHSRQS